MTSTTNSNHFRWEIELLKNISALNLLFFSTDLPDISLQARYLIKTMIVTYTLRNNTLEIEIDGKLTNKILLDQFKVKQWEKKQWPDHVQIKIQIHPHQDKEYTFLQVSKFLFISFLLKII